MVKKTVCILLFLTSILVLFGCSNKINQNGDIIYNQDGKLMTRNIKKNKEWELLEKEKKIGRMIVSKEKKYLAFQIFNKNPTIYIYNLNNIKLIKKIDNASLVGIYKDKKIAVAFDGNYEVKILDLETGEIKNLEIEYGDLSWSPDGNKIVYSKYYNDKKYRLFIKNLKTNETRELVPDTEENIQANCYWSPTGDKIAFIWNKEGFDQIYTIKPDGSNLKKITNSKSSKVFLSISPEGKYILFNNFNRIKKSNGLPKIVGNIYKVDMNGNNLEQLTFDKYKYNNQPYMINSD